MLRLSLFALLVTVGCASEFRRFPLREPMWKDTDLESRSVPCRPDPEEKGKQICRPREYQSSFAWDAADNLIFRPIVRFFAMNHGKEAVNVNSLDEVPDSAWFTNRIGRAPMSVEEIIRGSCEDVIDDENVADGAWLIDRGKPNGANPGFRVKLPDGRKYMFKADVASQPERATGATAIASRIYHAAGWWAACDTVVYVKTSAFKLAPGLTYTDNTGVTRPLDEPALENILRNAARRGDKVRFAASRWIPGKTIGPFTYLGTRDDDPGDVIPHEDRRDLRGARLIAAWLNHFDSREQNSMSTWLADNPDEPDSSPGQTRHYYIDLGDCFGSRWSPDDMWRRLGHAYYFDVDFALADLFTFGLVPRPWDRVDRPKNSIFGYFQAEGFDPAAWRPGYPNPAFARMTERDGAWAARIIARFTDEAIAAAVSVGDFTNPEHTAFLTEQLRLRRDKILRRYFARLSPVTDLVVEKDRVCGVDLARKTNIWPDGLFSYRARARGGARLADLGAARVEELEDGRLCVDLPRVAGDGGVRDDDPSRYLVVEIWNGQAVEPLEAHFYDLGPARGFVLVGIER